MAFKVSIAALLILFAPAVFPPPGTSAQSLGELARKFREEREAREKKGEVPVKVFTNEDIARLSSSGAALSFKPKSTTASHTGPPKAQAPPAGSSPKSGKAQSALKSKEYWQARFKAARSALAHAKEEQTLVENELRLLQIQQARELNPGKSSRLSIRIDSRTDELKAKRAATENAQQQLEETENDFKESGAPQDWIQDGNWKD